MVARSPGISRGSAVARWSFLIVVMIVLYGPLVVLALFSFNDSIVIALPFEGFTLQWYREALANTLVRESIKNSLLIGLIVMPLALALGTMAAFATTRFRYRGRGGVAALTGGPLVVPWLLIGGRRAAVLLEAEGVAQPADDHRDAHRGRVPAGGCDRLGAGSCGSTPVSRKQRATSGRRIARCCDSS